MKIYITGGIGDFIAIESRWDQSFRNDITEIYLGCFHSQEIECLLRKCSLPNLSRIVYFYTDFPAANNISGNIDLVNRKLNKAILRLDTDIMDQSVTSLFNNQPKFVGTSLLYSSLADISRFGLNDYCYICPYSFKASKQRQFNQKDWHNVLKILEYKNITGVVVTQHDDYIPKHDNIKLIDNVTINEACELVKLAKGYIGIDSFAATLAAQLTLNIFLVKSINESTHVWKKHIYFAPHKDFDRFLSYKINGLTRKLL